MPLPCVAQTRASIGTIFIGGPKLGKVFGNVMSKMLFNI